MEAEPRHAGEEYCGDWLRRRLKALLFWSTQTLREAPPQAHRLRQSVMPVVEIAVGLALLFGAAEALLRGAIGVARTVGLSPLLIGVVLVGFGTSTPELVASLKGALAGSPGIAIGNVVGSNIANILLILGLAAVITPLACTRRAFLRDGSALLAATLLLVLVCLAGQAARAAGAVLILCLLIYVFYTYRSDRSHATDASAQMHRAEGEFVAAVPGSPAKGLALTAASLLGLVLGAHWLIEGALALSRSLGVSEALLGLTLVAVGTSLPELATSTLAAARGQSDVAFGNIVGSNIFNSLGIVGATAVVRPVDVPPEIVSFDLWVMVGATLLLLVFAMTALRVTRWEGLILLLLYGAYLTLTIRFASDAA